MNGILGMSELLGETALDAQQALYAQTIYNSANALLDVINDILDFSKIQAEKISLNDVRFSLAQVVQDLSTLLRSRAEYKGIQLHANISDKLPAEFIGDAGKIRQIVMNLIGNAIKFTDKGHIRLHVSYKPQRKTYPLRIAVSDTGPGIAPSEKSKIFSAFERIDNTETRKEEGTGLGLAIVLMAFAATLIMKLLASYPWISWLGLIVLIYVAGDMAYRGFFDISHGIGPMMGWVEGWDMGKAH